MPVRDLCYIVNWALKEQISIAVHFEKSKKTHNFTSPPTAVKEKRINPVFYFKVITSIRFCFKVIRGKMKKKSCEISFLIF